VQQGGEPGIFRDLLELFQADAPPLLAAMRAAVTEGSPESLRAAGHGLKGVAANLGARELSRIAAELEALGRKGTVCDAEPLLAAAEAQFQQVCEALAAEAGGPG
jgi:two-component system, sensor histidine kinase